MRGNSSRRWQSFGYAVTRQSGSHIRLIGNTPTPHSLTVPDHSPLKVGTLHAILPTSRRISASTRPT